MTIYSSHVHRGVDAAVRHKKRRRRDQDAETPTHEACSTADGAETKKMKKQAICSSTGKSGGALAKKSSKKHSRDARAATAEAEEGDTSKDNTRVGSRALNEDASPVCATKARRGQMHESEENCANRDEASLHESEQDDSDAFEAEDADAPLGEEAKDKPFTKRKRKRRECWTIEQVRERMAELVAELEKRDELTKSRLKRIRARLAVLAKAERGEIEVGGQIEKAKKKKKRSADRSEGEGEKRKKPPGGRRDSSKSSRKLTGSQKKKLNKICLRCREKGHVLENCPLATATGPNSASPDAAAKEGEAKARPMMSGVCFNCGATDHTLKNCKKKRKPDGSLPFALCFICGAKGHLSAGCPQSTTGKYPKGGCCRTCGSIYHLQIECPEFQKQQKELADQKKLGGASGGSRSRPDGGKEHSGDRLKPRSFSGNKAERKTPQRTREADPDEYWQNA
ncbi:zinc knuckle domain-containing protein [Besnoitia besnoiti]|uniref:Zinc knuckle domain-containing protein n=1 Tax=Besnoitia besnoiti TaxID=94643 RepID=A0A2A9MHL6_BESBE|nr:zinc knuckle domain-containing protein [Besnoitia besnoiti]PFH37465.1 zinc knuckle domain-containing protein [Besnoitia besnoiti]